MKKILIPMMIMFIGCKKEPIKPSFTQYTTTPPPCTDKRGYSGNYVAIYSNYPSMDTAILYETADSNYMHFPVIDRYNSKVSTFYAGKKCSDTVDFKSPDVGHEFTYKFHKTNDSFVLNLYANNRLILTRVIYKKL